MTELVRFNGDVYEKYPLPNSEPIAWLIRRRLPQPGIEPQAWPVESAVYMFSNITDFLKTFHVEVCDIIEVRPLDFVYDKEVK